MRSFPVCFVIESTSYATLVASRDVKSSHVIQILYNAVDMLILKYNLAEKNLWYVLHGIEFQ